MSSSQKKQVLHIGLSGRSGVPPPNSTGPGAGLTPEQLESHVKAGAQRARDTGLYDVQLTFFHLETFEQTLSDFRKEMQSGKWDAIVVGGGLKGSPTLTPQFELVVNAARELSPRTKLLFQSAPGDIDATIQRGFKDD